MKMDKAKASKPKSKKADPEKTVQKGKMPMKQMDMMKKKKK